ncbi:MAG: guanylate kinase [Rikenellaceae bacterium]
MNNNKVIIFSAPSGSGKSTIISQLLQKFTNFEFSISATSRAPRGEEKNGVDYYFLTEEEFKTRVDNDEFIEYEEVYKGTSYGTLKSELNRIWSKGNIVIFDVDVIGGTNIKKMLKEDAISIFIMPPSVETLRSRLISRNTDTMEAIERRVAKAENEISFAPKFSKVVINDTLEKAVEDVESIIVEFLK